MKQTKQPTHSSTHKYFEMLNYVLMHDYHMRALIPEYREEVLYATTHQTHASMPI